jgi:hypothetical protein
VKVSEAIDRLVKKATANSYDIGEMPKHLQLQRFVIAKRVVACAHGIRRLAERLERS